MISQHLRNSSGAVFICWCILASFGAYFSMYAFRKPFTTGLYESLTIWGLHYKSILIVAQVLGYMLSKFAGIKVISELRSSQRIKLIIGLILFAELALLGFAWIAPPYNILFMFLNGLPLGMVWGIIFSFLEGRRFTEMLAFGLSISIIVSSGILKTIYLEIQQLSGVAEFWMPALIGLLFLPFFCLFVWMLSVIPDPSEEDKCLRSERVPMNKKDKQRALFEFGPGLICIVVFYALLTTMRDMRDNFSVEIWNEIDPGWNGTVFSQTELIIGIVVLLVIGAISFIRNNIKGLQTTLTVMAAGILISGLSTLLFHLELIDAFSWMLCLGMGLFVSYMPVQTVIFERMIGLFRTKANAGFFVYICDSIGYLGSVSLLLYKELFIPKMSWATVLMNFSYGLLAAGALLLTGTAIFFSYKYSKREADPQYVPEERKKGAGRPEKEKLNASIKF